MTTARFYLGDPHAPKPNRPTKLGVNVLVEYDGKLLMEYRRDCDFWGLIGGGVKGAEPERRAAARELREETGIVISPAAFEKIGVFEEKDRICAYRNGEVRRMVCILYRIRLEREPTVKVSKESRQLKFFTPEELKKIQIAPTHVPMVALFHG